MAKLKAMSGEQLAKSMPFFGIMNYPAVVYLQFLNNHMIHHRGQLSTYLRAMNAHVPSIYGGSADEPFTGSRSFFPPPSRREPPWRLHPRKSHPDTPMLDPRVPSGLFFLLPSLA